MSTEGRIFVFQARTPAHRDWCYFQSYAVREKDMAALTDKLKFVRRRIARNMSEKVNFKSRARDESAVAKAPAVDAERMLEIAKKTVRFIAKRHPLQQDECRSVFNQNAGQALLSLCGGRIEAMFVLYTSRPGGGGTARLPGCMAIGPLRKRAAGGALWERATRSPESWPDAEYFGV